MIGPKCKLCGENHFGLCKVAKSAVDNRLKAIGNKPPKPTKKKFTGRKQ